MCGCCPNTWPALARVRPQVKYKVFALTLVYIGVGLVSEFETQLKDATSVTLFNRMMFILPLTGIDTCFVIWSATSLVDTMKGLSLHRQLVKLSLYKWFARTLAACVFISVLFIAFQLLQAMKHDFDQHWKMLWIFDAFWHSLYFLVLMVLFLIVHNFFPCRSIIYRFALGRSWPCCGHPPPTQNCKLAMLCDHRTRYHGCT